MSSFVDETTTSSTSPRGVSRRAGQSLVINWSTSRNYAGGRPARQTENSDVTVVSGQPVIFLAVSRAPSNRVTSLALPNFISRPSVRPPVGRSVGRPKPAIKRRVFVAAQIRRELPTHSDDDDHTAVLWPPTAAAAAAAAAAVRPFSWNGQGITSGQ